MQVIRRAILFNLALIGVVVFTTDVSGRAHRVDQIPNGAVLACLTCHVSAQGGDARNPFGLAIEAEFLSSISDTGNVLWSSSLASRDSDGDGFTNGQELGDPEGTGIPDSNAVVSAPGNASDFPMAAFVGATLDVSGDGHVDNADFDIFAPRFASSATAAVFDSTIDFNADLVNGFDDLRLLLQNLGVASSDTVLALTSGAGQNVDVLPTLDFDNGNGEINGLLSGDVSGEGTLFQLEVFLGNVQGSLSAVEIQFGLNRELARVTGFSGSGARLVATSDSSVTLADLGEVSLAANGFLGTLQLTTVSDVTAVPVRVELQQVIVVDSASGLANTRAAGGIGVTANPLDSVLPDLNGDGLVDEADFGFFVERFVPGVGRQDSRFDETIDFDLDEQLTEEDVLLFLLNFGRSQETFTFFRSPQPGANVDARVMLDFDAGNFVNDSVTSGTVSGDGEIFSFDVYAAGIVADVTMVSIVFDVDFSEVSLFDYEPPFGMQAFGTTDSSAIFGVVPGQDASDGYLGRVDFMAASDLTGIPTPIRVKRLTLAEAGTVLANDADVSGSLVILNEEVDAQPSADIQLLGVELDSLEIETDVFTGPLDVGSHQLMFLLNAPLLDATDDFGDPAFAGGLPVYQNFRSYLMPDPFAVGGAVTAAKGFDEESLLVTIELPEDTAVQAVGSAVPEFGPQTSADYFFGTSDGSGAEISGSVIFGQGLGDLDRAPGPPHVTLLTTPPNSLVEGAETEADVIDALASAWVRGDYLSGEGTFNLRFVPDGDYYMYGRITVIVDGEPKVATGVLLDATGEAEVLTVSEGSAISGINLSIDLPLEAIEIQGVVLAAVEFEGDNLFVETESGDLFEVLAEGAGLTTFGGDLLDDITAISVGDSVSVAGSSLSAGRIRATSISANIIASPKGPPADFTGDGLVDFSDFLVFATGFGVSADDPGFDARLDLDSSGDVGFGDFLAFVTAFTASSG